MLKHLYIKNFTLIDELDIDFRQGFSVITGETGAGKSIILGAVGLLLGQRADSKTIKQGAAKCVIEARFDLSRYDFQPFFDENDIEYDAHDTIVRRELTSAGKSRAFINDTPVALSLLKELGEQLVDVHSQHQNLLLSKHDFQLSVVDILAGDRKELADYRAVYNEYRQVGEELQAAERTIEQNQQNADFLQFQYDELSSAHLASGEQEELEQRSDTMTHSEDIKSALYMADQALSGDQDGIVDRLRQAASALRAVERVYPQVSELADRLESAHIELKDVAGDVSSRLDAIDFDPAELDAVNQRLDKLYDLEKKYHVDTIEALLSVLHDIEQKINALENSDEVISELRRKQDDLRQKAAAKATVLTTMRSKAAHHIEAEMHSRLQLLGMPNVRFQVSIGQGELGPSGHDMVAFLFSANTSTTLQPVAQIASGGEIARVMLSLKALISGAVKLPTIIFDEIDTGVSGKIAGQMAQVMREMGHHERQVISITHLPQIAAMGTTHYKVFKQETSMGTTSQMKLLNDDERVAEIAQMLSGNDVSEAAMANARQLLKS